MARAIDAEALEKKISEWLGQPGNGDYYSGYDAALCAVQDLIADTPTLTPPNEPLTLDKKRMIAESCLHYSKSGSCTLRGYAPLDCPRCKEWQSNESNEPLTLEELREMEGQWIIIKAFDADISGIMPAFIKDQFATTLCELGSKAIVPDLCEVHFSFNEYGKTWIAYRRPKEEQ